MTCAKLTKARERVAVARHQAAGAVFDVGQGAKAVALELIDPGWIAKCFAKARQAHWCNCGENHWF